MRLSEGDEGLSEKHESEYYVVQKIRIEVKEVELR